VLAAFRSILLPRLSRRDRAFRRLRYRVAELPLTRQVFYTLWRRLNEPSDEDLEQQRVLGRTLTDAPRFGVVVSADSHVGGRLSETLTSLFSQTYEHWQARVITGEDALAPDVAARLESDARVTIIVADANGRVKAINHALQDLAADFVGFLNAGDTLAASCLFDTSTALRRAPETDLIYHDSDLRGGRTRRRHSPFFKPAFNLLYLYSIDYLSRFFVIRKDIGERLGWLRAGLNGAELYDLVLRAAERARQITHVPGVHCHVLEGDSPTRDTGAARNRALREHFERSQRPAHVDGSAGPDARCVTFVVPDSPLVSILIPNRDQVVHLRRAIDSILRRSTHGNIEILVVENASTEAALFAFYDELRASGKVRVLKYEDAAFNFSRINNFAVSHAAGDVVLFLNNDVEVINVDWLERMLEYAMQPEVGAVGAKLLYPDDTIQHAGILLEGHYRSNHRFLCYPSTRPGYFDNLITPQETSAVTGACVMMRRRVFDQIGGFDPRFHVGFGDVDLCLTARQHGYRVVWTPHARLYHFESLTRGYDNRAAKRLHAQEELAQLRLKWGHVLEQGDPFFNPNLTLELFNYLPAPKRCRNEPRTLPGPSMFDAGHIK
jgi:O-antigen biosynthesis protein